MWRPGEDCGSRFKVNLARGGLHHPKEPFLLHRWGQAAVAAPQGGQDSPPEPHALSTAPTGPGVRLTALLPEGLGEPGAQCSQGRAGGGDGMAQTRVLSRNLPPLTCPPPPSTHIGSLELPFLSSREIKCFLPPG